MLKRIMLTLSILLLAACATTGDQIKKISAGMTKDEVIEIVGSADGYRVVDGVEYLIYSQRPMGIFDGRTADYVIAIRDNRVVEYQLFNIAQGANIFDVANDSFQAGQNAKARNTYYNPAPSQFRQPVTCHTYQGGIIRCY